MAAISVIVRRSSYFRQIWRSTNTNFSTTTTPLRSNPLFQQTNRIFGHSYTSRLRRESSLFLSSLLPFHSATASACLVSELPSEVSASAEFQGHLGLLRLKTAAKSLQADLLITLVPSDGDLVHMGAPSLPRIL